MVFGLPAFAEYYPEMVNLIESASVLESKKGDVPSVTVIFTRFDVMRLERIVGSERCNRILSAEQDTHIFVT